MKKTITLNIDDIKQLISTNFNIRVDEIQVEIYGPDNDGPRTSSGSVFFSFDKFDEVKHWQD